MHLTYPNQDAYSEQASTANAKEAGASEKEIEVTPAMISAGVTALAFYDPGFEHEPWAVARIYRAIETARRAEVAAQFCVLPKDDG
jgi:hypothetical protein